MTSIALSSNHFPCWERLLRFESIAKAAPEVIVPFGFQLFIVFFLHIFAQCVTPLLNLFDWIRYLFHGISFSTFFLCVSINNNDDWVPYMKCPFGYCNNHRVHIYIWILYFLFMKIVHTIVEYIYVIPLLLFIPSVSYPSIRFEYDTLRSLYNFTGKCNMHQEHSNMTCFFIDVTWIWMFFVNASQTEIDPSRVFLMTCAKRTHIKVITKTIICLHPCVPNLSIIIIHNAKQRIFKNMCWNRRH